MHTVRSHGVSVPFGFSWLLVGSIFTSSACAEEAPNHISGAGDIGASVLATPADDASPPRPDVVIPEQRPDALLDAGTEDASTTPLTTTELGSTGRIEVADDFIGAVFYADDTILRAVANPECVVHLESAEKAFSRAGTLSVSSDRVGHDGGPPTTIEIGPDGNKEYWAFPNWVDCSSSNPVCPAEQTSAQLLYDFPDGSRVQIQLAGTSVFPAVAATTLLSPAFGPIEVTAPAPPDSGVLTIPSDAPLEITWNVPPMMGAAAAAGQQLSVRIFALSPVRWGQLYCSWPLIAGGGAVPGVLLREFRRQLGSTGPLDAAIDLYAGGFKEVTT